MTLNLNNLRTFYNALVQKFKNYRGNWEQNDPTADDYIKNRPFYSEVKVHTDTLVDNLTLEQYINGDAPRCTFVVGQKYTIIWNGEKYETICYSDGEFRIIADSSIGCPFYIDDDGGNSLYVELDNDEPWTITVSTITKSEVVHKLDKKFIDMPDSIGSSGTGKNAEIFNDYINNIASGEYSHAEGRLTKASGKASHAEGDGTTASGDYSHTEGTRTAAIGYCSHAEGSDTVASGAWSHAEGIETRASGDYSHAEGSYTTAASVYQHTQGKYNIEDFNNVYTHIVGNGRHGSLSNAHTLDWDGNAWYQGDVYVGSTSGTNKDEGSKKLATEEYVDSRIDQCVKVEDIDQCVKVEDMEVTETFTWDLDTRDRYYLRNGDISYYKVSDKNIDVKDIISFTVISNTQSFPENVESGDGYHIEQGIAIFNKIGIVTTSAGKQYNIQSPGIYFGCSTEKKVGVSPAEHYAARGITKASITYKADSIHSDIVGIVRSVNGITPDTDGNVELTVLDDANKYTDEQIANHKHSYNDLTDKPFYEETEVINEPLNITWDGNTEGLVCVETPSSDPVFYKISSIILTDEQIKMITDTDSTGHTEKVGEYWDDLVEQGQVSEDLVAAMAIYVRKDGAELFGTVFPETGIYFPMWFNGDHQTSITTTEPIEYTKTVVHKLDKKFLPKAETSDIVFTGVQNDDGWYDYTCNVDYVKARKAFIDGATARMIWVSENKTTHLTLQTVHYRNGYVNLNFFDIRDTNNERGIINYYEDGSIGGGVE